MQIVKPEIKSAIFSLKECLVEREADVSLDKGLNEIILDPLEPVSVIHNISISGGELVSFSYRNIAKPRKDIVPEEVSEILKKMTELKRKISILEQEKAFLENEINGIMDATQRIYKSLSRKIKEISTLYSSILNQADTWSKHVKEKRRRIIELDEELERLRAEYKSLSNTISALSSTTVNVGQVKLLIKTEEKTMIKINIKYTTNIGQWTPEYILDISKKADEVVYVLRHRIRVVQTSALKWNNVQLTFTISRPRTILYHEPQPWFIEPIRQIVIPEVGAPPPAMAAPRAVPMKARPREKIISERYLGTIFSYRLSEKVTLLPSTPLIIDMAKIKIEPKKYYVWDAFRGGGVKEIIEFENKELEILPSKCYIYMDGRLVNSFDVGHIPIGKKETWAIREEPGIVVRRKLVKREEKTKGIISEKAYIRLKYEYEIENKLPEEAKLVVYDRRPVPRDPKIEVKVDEVSHDVEINDVGIVKWELKLKSGDKVTMHLEYTVYFPPDYRIPL